MNRFNALRKMRRGQEDEMRLQQTNRTQQFTFANVGMPEKRIALATGQGWAVKGRRRHQTLFCFEGRVWITQENDLRDYVIEAGQAFMITQPGLVLVRALRPSHIGYGEHFDTAAFSGPFSRAVFN